MATYGLYPSSGTTTVDNVAWTTILELNINQQYHIEQYGNLLLHLRPTVRNFTDLRFRIALDGSTFEPYYAIPDNIAAKIVPLCTAGAVVPIALHSPKGVLRVQARATAGDGACVVAYTELETPVQECLINGQSVSRFDETHSPTPTQPVNLAVDNTDLITYAVPDNVKNVLVFNTGLDDMHVAAVTDTALGTRGIPLARANNVGGVAIVGSGGSVMLDNVKGLTLTFYTATNTTARIVVIP